MEESLLQVARKRAVGRYGPCSFARLYIEPPILGLLFLVADLALFAVPGLVIASRQGLLAAAVR